MKKILMSIFLVLMLAVSMLGNVNIAKAENDNIDVGNIIYNPTTAIKEVNQFVEVTFRVANIGDEGEALSLNFTISSPRLGGNPLGDALNVGDPVPENIRDLTVGEDPVEVTFTVTGIGENTLPGTYIGNIRVYEVDAEGNPVVDEDGNLVNFIDRNYQIIVADSNPSISVTGLNDDEELVFTGEEDTQPTEEFTITNNGNIILNDLQLIFPVQEEFKDSDDNQINFKVKQGEENYNSMIWGQPVELNDLNVDESLTISIQADIPEDIELDIYNENVLIRSLEDYTEELNTNLIDDSFEL
ncbi:MAG: hypothetical protein ACTSXD_09570, partial [Candidatus Heimdallarchaeaceae archaeon]